MMKMELMGIMEHDTYDFDDGLAILFLTMRYPTLLRRGAWCLLGGITDYCDVLTTKGKSMWNFVPYA